MFLSIIWKMNNENIIYMCIGCLINKRAQRALDHSPETKDFKFPFFIALSTTGDTWQSKS